MTEKPLNILLVEDSARDAGLVREMFRTETPGSFALTHVGRLSDALTHLAAAPVDILLLDMGLPDGHGLDTVRRAHAAAPEVPLIVMTGMDDEAAAAQAMQAGAQDYLIKGQIETRALPRALRYAIERHRMQAETELLRNRQARLKDEFLSHVSHELRSPLTAIHQFVGILTDGLVGELNAEQQEYLLIALKNCRQLKSMIDDLLEATSAEAGKSRIDLQSTSIPELVVETVTSLQETAAIKGIALFWEIAPEVSTAYADPTRVRQILIILIDNALKFTPANGVVKVRVRVREHDPRFLFFEVSDSGCGIAPDMIERVFERLFQAPNADKAGRLGLGLGLHISKELVKRMGGEISATSDAGRGATLSFTLPVFSVASLIAPALTRPRLMGTIALVVTELQSRTGWLSRETDMFSQEVREVLERSMYSDLDVLLPKMGQTMATELFFIVAVTDQIGAEAIAKRILAKLAERPHLAQAGLTCATRYRLLRPVARTKNESMEEYVGRIAVDIQDAAHQESSSKGLIQ